MTKFSLGDFAVNEQVSEYNSDAPFTLEDFNKKETDIESVKDKKPEDVQNFIPIQKNEDGSLKYTFDNIYENKQLASVAKDYYKNRDGESFNDKEAVDKFISDRTWNQANTYQMGKEFLYVTGNNITQDQKARLSYLTRYWDELPNFYEEGGRGASGFFANLGVGLLDPLNIVGAGVGGLVSKSVLKKVGQEVIKSQVKKGVTKKTLAKEVLNSPEQLAELSAKANKSALLKGSGSMAAVEGAGFGTIDIANQLVEKDIGLRETLDPVRTGTIALTATGLGFFVGAGAGYLGSKIRNLKLQKNTTLTTDKLKKTSKNSPDNKNQSDAINGELNKTSYVRTNLADQWDFVKVLQKEINPESAIDVTDLKKLYKSGDFKTDPILEPYFQLRMLASSGTRAHNFIMEGIYLPPSDKTKMASYIKGKSQGLHEILDPFDKFNEVNEFLGYVASKRMQGIAKRRPKLDKTLPLDKATREEFIDFAEMSASDFKKKYKKRLTRKSNFINSLNKFKQFTDELLEYQVASGLLSRKDANKILRENPFFIPLTRDKKSTSFVSAVGQQTQKLLGIARPGAVKLAKQKQEGDINLYQNLVNYTYQTVLASDRNRAKISFYNMLQKGDKLNKIDMDSVVRLVTGDRRIQITNVARDKIVKAYTNAGSKFDPEKGVTPRVGAKRKDQISNLDSLDVLTFSNTFKASDDASADFADIVYRNGKAEVYEIIDPNLAQTFKGLSDKGADRVMFGFGPRGIFSRYARFASQAITYSPPFVAFNAIRDTLAGSVNSAFGITPKGFKPVYTSGKGFIAAVRQTQNYKRALLNGMGYSSRTETEAFTPKNVKDLVKKGANLGVFSNTTNYYNNIIGRYINKIGGGGWRGYKRIVQSTEYATRMGEYQLAKAAGFSDMGAAFLGREVATDFGMRGSSSFLNAINRNTMFFNASIQGLYRTGRLFFENPGKAVSLIGATVVAPEVALYHINSRHKEYSQVPDQVKQLNYLVPNYTTDDNGNTILDKEVPFIAIPKPYDLGVFANVAVGLMDGMYKKSDGVTKKYVAESFSQITPGIPIPAGARPFIELMFNKNFYTGAPVVGIYEMRRLDELQARGSTRELAKRLSNFTGNMNAFLLRSKEGAKVPQVSPIVMDYLMGAYFTGLMQYPLDILNAQLKKKPLEGEPAVKREDEADFASFENAASIVTRRFKVVSPIKRSQYHNEWSKLISRAKKLKQIDMSQMDLEKRNQSFLIGLFGRISENLKEGMPAGVEPEVLEFAKISPILKEVETELRKLRTEKNNITNSPIDPIKKREILDILLGVENNMLKSVMDSLAVMDIEYIFDQTYTDNVKEIGVIQGTLSSLIFGTAENAFKPNPREE
tara:strand:- start:896 stop:4972 length:4077 start_codon:yes stop_codon:yes gene_type:complete